MSEIVRIKSSGIVGIVVESYTSRTGSELLEVQPVGRNMARFVSREDVDAATQRDMAGAVALAILLAIS